MANYDLLIMQGEITDAHSAPVEMSFGNVTQATDTVQKAVQQWLVAFCTMRGSVLGDETYGSSFMANIRGINLGNVSAISTAFSTAANEVVTWLRANNSREMIANDEVVVAAELVSAAAVDDTLRLVIRLRTQSGETRIVTQPISQLNV